MAWTSWATGTGCCGCAAPPPPPPPPPCFLNPVARRWQSCWGVMVTLEVPVVCAVVFVVVWVAVCVEVAAVVVIVLDGVMLCRVDTNLLCKGRLMVGEMGLL